MSVPILRQATVGGLCGCWHQDSVVFSQLLPHIGTIFFLIQCLQLCQQLCWMVCMLPQKDVPLATKEGTLAEAFQSLAISFRCKR